MALIKTDTGQVRIQKATGLLVTPYDENGILGNDTYDIHAIVGDTIKLTPEDPETNEIPWEFGDTPLDSSITLGNTTFEAECLDFQNTIMQALYGCEIIDDIVVFPATYKDLYCFVRITLPDRDIVLPYVKMNSKATIESMRSDIARGTISGSLMAKEVGISPRTGTTSPGVTIDAAHTRTTSMLFVTTENDVFVGNKTDDKVFDTSSMSTITISPYLGTSINDGNMSIDASVGVVSGSGTYPNGSVIALRAVANDGYELIGIRTASSGSILTDSSDGVFALEVTASENYRAVFKVATT